MPNTTYLQAVNNVLIRINEVQLTSANFNSVIGVHAMVKTGVINAIDKINQTESVKWPFYAVEQTVTLVAGTQEYAWPDNFQSVDWKSFQIQKDDTIGNRNKFLTSIEREQWYRYLRDSDYDARPDGLNIPDYVFSTHGRGFGLSPSPKEAYTLKYRYFKNPVRPTLYSDEVPTPPEFDYVLEAGGLYQAYIFYDNNERATLMKQDRDDGIKDMVRVLIGNNFENVYSGVLNASTGNRGLGNGLV